MTRPATIAIMAAMLSMAAGMETDMAQAQTQTTTQTTAQAPLPGGANAINETFQDWRVLCSTAETGRQCLLSQQQRHRQTGQLVLAAEFADVAKDRLGGTLVLPFGLSLADGVTLQVDDGPVSKPLPFATCLPAGCIVRLGFDAGFTAALRAGTTLNLTAKAHDSAKNVQFAISLRGFAAAQDRAVALMQP